MFPPLPNPETPLTPAEPARPSLRDRALVWIIRTPSTGFAAIVVGLLTIVFAALMLWAHQSPMLAVGRIMDQARTARVGFSTIDREQTEKDREAAYRRAPRVYTLDTAPLDELRVALESLPRICAAAGKLENVPADWSEAFGLNPQSFAALVAATDNAEPTEYWHAKVTALDRLLRAHPMISQAAALEEAKEMNEAILIRTGSGAEQALVIPESDLIAAPGPRVGMTMRTLSFLAGFTGAELEAVTTRLTRGARPNATLDENATAREQAAARDRTSEHVRTFEPGQVLVGRGERLSSEQVERLRLEAAAYLRDAKFWQRMLGDTSVLAIGFLAALGVAAFTAAYAPRAMSNPSQLAAIGAVLAAGLTLTCWAGAAAPGLIVAAAVVPSSLVACVLAVAFDRRTSLALGSLLGLVACLALQQPMTVYGLTLMGVGLTVLPLREVRRRQSLVYASLVAGVGVALGGVVLLGVQRPMVDGIFSEIVSDAVIAGAGVGLIGFIVLGGLPLVERWFAVTTGLSLVELRDPQRPLLRELQRRAPGTYNHSLNVASMAEAAATSINADGLLAYVGALYHDVGKMNKPEFFVENQTGGVNRHDRLSPAMSLLVIVGHVKDGIELARQFKVPLPLHHFIEAHHGTTLVEYFYHRARRQAESAPPGTQPVPPVEVEYRYPGPKPRTKEVAILMICDAAESATRSLPDPAPGKIDSLVRAIAHKRLMDGQFDECDLTLKELNTIIEAVVRTLAAIHHSRIAYPEQPKTAPGAGAPVGKITPSIPPLPTPPPAPTAARA